MIKLRIDELLERTGKTAYWLGKRPGLTHTSVYRLRHGRTGAIKFETIEALCDALKCEPGELFVRSPARPTPRKSLRKE